MISFSVRNNHRVHFATWFSILWRDKALRPRYSILANSILVLRVDWMWCLLKWSADRCRWFNWHLILRISPGPSPCPCCGYSILIVGPVLCVLQLHLCQAIKCKWTASCTIFGRQSVRLFRFHFDIFHAVDSSMRHTICYCDACSVCVQCALCPYSLDLNKRTSISETNMPTLTFSGSQLWSENSHETNANRVLFLHLALSKTNWMQIPTQHTPGAAKK